MRIIQYVRYVITDTDSWDGSNSSDYFSSVSGAKKSAALQVKQRALAIQYLRALGEIFF